MHERFNKLKDEQRDARHDFEHSLKADVINFYREILKDTNYPIHERQAFVKSYGGETLLIDLLTEMMPS